MDKLKILINMNSVNAKNYSYNNNNKIGFLKTITSKYSNYNQLYYN